MGEVQYIEVSVEQDGMRIDRWFRTSFPQIKQGQVEKMLRKGQIRLDSAKVKSNSRIMTGQIVRVPPIPVRSFVKQTTKPVHFPKEFRNQILDSVIYKDDDLIALNKPSGMAVQGGSKVHFHIDSALDLLQFDALERPRLVHRLDKDTSGVLLLARNRKMASFLSKSFLKRDIRKIYWGLTEGVPRPEQGDINVPLLKKNYNGYERVQPAEYGDEKGLKAITRFCVIDRVGQNFSFVAFMPITGRTHQIRVHSLAMGHALVGDDKYVNPNKPTDDTIHKTGTLYQGDSFKKLHLHARFIELPHPTKKTIQIYAPLTGHMLETWSFLGLDASYKEDPFPVSMK